AVNYGNVPEKRLREILQRPEAKLEFRVQTQKEIDGKRQELATIKDGLYKIVKLREIIPQLRKALRTGEIREEQQKLREKLREFESRLGDKEKTILQYLRSPKKVCNDTKHYERLERILSKAYLENQRNRLEKDPEIGQRLIHSIPIDNIDPDPGNPRGEYEENEMENLTDSIREVGLLNPILVEKADGRYKIVVGHRRIEAVRRAGQKNIGCFVVEELPKHLRLYLQVVEDSQEAFTNDERANSWNQLYDLMSKELKKETVLTILEFSRRVGKNAKTVGTAIRYEKMLSEDVKRMVEEGLLPYSTAIPLTTMVNLNKDDREEVERMKTIQYELAINAILGNYTKERMADAVKKELSQKNQMDLFPKAKGGLEGIVGRLKEQAYWQMKSLNLLFPHLQTDEGTLKRICSLERTLRII
ncbi:MAG: ParB/RepB/Spo0J family partition protein, partial [archaeon]